MTQTAQATMNFLPEDYVEKRQATRAAVIFIGLLVVVVFGIIGAYLFVQFESRAVFDQRDQVNAQFEEASKAITKAQEMDQEKATMVAKAELTTTLMERVRRSAILAELTALQPKGVNMVSIDLETHELPHTGAAAKPAATGAPAVAAKPPDSETTIELVGTAPTDGHVAQYIAALTKSPLLSDVNMIYSEEYKRTRDDTSEVVRKFRVEMKVNPEADLRRLGDTGAPTAAPSVPAGVIPVSAPALSTDK